MRTQGANRPLGWSRSLCGVFAGASEHLTEGVSQGLVRMATPKGLSLPQDFEAAAKWPACSKVINDIRDQSNCGCCWAFAPASAASDRLCIATAGSSMLPLSAQELCFCAQRNGCGGGLPGRSWRYIIEHGLVTGGQQEVQDNGTNPDAFAEQRFCSKFSLPHCHHHGPQRNDPFAPEGDASCPEVSAASSPSCPSSCDPDANAPHGSFRVDRYRIAGGWVSWFQGATSIAEALVTDGSVTASLDVYEDFENYVGGVYQHAMGSLVGKHAVRIVGYGVSHSHGVRYWKVANSWNPYWGERGFFRILRGVDHCGIESDVLAGVGAWSRGSRYSLERLERGNSERRNLRQGQHAAA